jgi:hypothetical protein
VFYLPEYPETTSGKDYWITYVGPWDYSKGRAYVKDYLRKVRRVQSDAYGLKIDDHGSREEVR